MAGGAEGLDRKALTLFRGHRERDRRRPCARRRDDGTSGPWGFDRKTLTLTLSHRERGKIGARAWGFRPGLVGDGVDLAGGD